MLSIAKISDAGVAVSYYEKDDYYTANGDDPDAQGQWYGDGAERLGLRGAVNRDDFKDLLEGRISDGTVLGTVREKGGEREHRPGWDLTFSAPKSVSLVAEIGQDKAVIEAHQVAVRAALDWLEDTSAGTRVRGANGTVERQNTANLVIATFQHDTNRNHDPQLHTHAVVVNATQREDGKWRSLDDKRLFETQKATGTVYRAALAVELQKLGYQVEVTHADGRFEIAGIPTEAIAEFSTRRAEIEAALRERGLSGPEASEQAALMTRHTKQPENRAELARDWGARAGAIGFDPRPLVEQARDRAGDVPAATAEDGRRALQTALSRLSDQEAVFSHSNLIAWTLAAGMGKLTAAQAESLIAQEKAAGRLHEAAMGPQKALTTVSSVQQEQRIQEALEAGKGAVRAAYSAAEAAQVLVDLPGVRAREAEAARNAALWAGESPAAAAKIRGGALNDGQSAAVQMILSTEDRIVGVLGRPGTGKTYMLGETRRLMADHGLNMVGMAMNAEAARQLQSSAGMPAQTVQKHLKAVGGDAARLMRASPSEAAEIRAAYEKQVWVFDEASQANNRTMRRVTSLAEKLGARVVLVGDPDQLGAIEAGKPFARMLANGMRHREMDEIRRQADPRHVEAIRAAIAKDFGKALDKLAPETRVIEDRGARLDSIIQTWSAAGDRRDRTLMLTARNSTRVELNDRARQVLRSEGKLAGEAGATQLLGVFSSRADTALASTYKPGQVIQFQRNLKTLGVRAGEYVRVAEVNHRAGLVMLDVGGKRVPWAPAVIAGGTQHAPQIFTERQTTLAPGERITWSKNNPELGLTNGQRLTVLGTTERAMTVQTEDGRRIEIDRGQRGNQHWEHGYATTIYKSQGQTAERVLVDVSSSDRQLLSQKAFLVAVSRQTDQITLYTDDIEKLRTGIERNTGDKLSALESRIDSFSIVQRAADSMMEQRDRDREAAQVIPKAPERTPVLAPRPTRGFDLER